MICNNYGNVFIKFLFVVFIDNYEKVFFYYQEVLDVCIKVYFYERVIIFLNFLEVSWDVGNDFDFFNEQCFQDMLMKVEEVKILVDYEEMIVEVNKYLVFLEKLRVMVVLQYVKEFIYV